MITDAQLDAQLDALQARTLGENDHFAAVADFKARFFARAHAAAEATPKNTDAKTDETGDKRSLWDRIVHPRGAPAPAPGIISAMRMPRMAKLFAPAMSCFALASASSICWEEKPSSRRRRGKVTSGSSASIASSSSRER